MMLHLDLNDILLNLILLYLLEYWLLAGFKLCLYFIYFHWFLLIIALLPINCISIINNLLLNSILIIFISGLI